MNEIRRELMRPEEDRRRVLEAVRALEGTVRRDRRASRPHGHDDRPSTARRRPVDREDVGVVAPADVVALSAATPYSVSGGPRRLPRP
jgi:hypothetical protein